MSDIPEQDHDPGNPASRLEQELLEILGSGPALPDEEPPPPADEGGHHTGMPDGCPHVPPYMFARMKVSRTSKYPEDYANAFHHMFNYVAVLNGIPEDSFEIIGTIFEEPEFGFDLIFVVCLMNCDHATFPLEDLDKWLDFFFPTDSRPNVDHGHPLEDE